MKKAIIIETIKKLFILSAAVITLLVAAAGIIDTIIYGFRPVVCLEDVIHVIVAIVAVPVSILVIFNIKLSRALGIPLAIISILMALSCLAWAGVLLLSFKPGMFLLDRPLHLYLLCSIILIIVYVPPSITFAIYAIRALKPAEEKK